MGVWSEAIGWIGDCISLILFLATLPTFRTIRAEESVGENSPLPFLAAFLNCAIWVLYAKVHKNSGPLVAINCIGLLFEFGYLVCFLKYAGQHVSQKLVLMLVLEVLFVGAVSALGFGLGIAPETFGAVGIATGIAMYASPLYTTYTAYQNENVKGLDRNLSLAMLANASCWAIYVVIIGMDYFILVPNLVGVVSAGLQLVVYAKFKDEGA